MTLEEAYTRCTTLATEHYENFPVGRLVPKELRPHIHTVYAFARIADDFADEGYIQTDDYTPPTQEQRLQNLDQYEEQLTAAFLGKKLDPKFEWIFLPLAHTSKTKILPRQLFYDLLSAFKQDVTKNRYQTFDQVLDYCRRSANPVGRLVLHLHDYREPKLHQLSDHICTALQLANFWQDIAVDLLKNRIYIPQNDQQNFGLTEQTLFEKNPTPEFRKCLKFQVDRTWQIFEQGKTLPKFLKQKLSWEIRLTWLGGTTILKKIKKQNYNTLSKRPHLTLLDALLLIPYAWLTR